MLISLQLAKPFHSLDKGASIARVDNTWSAIVSDEAHKTGNKLLVSRLDSISRRMALERLHVI